MMKFMSLGLEQTLKQGCRGIGQENVEQVVWNRAVAGFLSCESFARVAAPPRTQSTAVC